MRKDKVPLLDADAHDADSGGDSDPGPAWPASHHPAGGSYTLAEVALHSTIEDCWVVIHGAVYDVTAFLSQHPGGTGALSKAGRGGADVSAHFDRIGHSAKAKGILATLRIGVVSVVSDSHAHEGLAAQPTAAALAAAALEEAAYSVAWHGTRRQAILNAHPEVAELEGANHFTVLLGIAVSLLHGWVTVQCQLWGWFSVLFAAWTVGAWCKMSQFAINHEVCHGTAGCLAPRALRSFWHHALTLPSFGGETQHYYAWQHIGHHGQLGEIPILSDIGDGGIKSLDSFDGDLPSPSAIMLLLGFNPVGEEPNRWTAMLILPGDSLWKKICKKVFFSPIAQALWFFSTVWGEVLVAGMANPLSIPVVLAWGSMPHLLSFVKVHFPGLFSFIKKYIDLESIADRYYGTPFQRDVVLAGCDVGFHGWLWVGLGVWLLLYSIPADQVTFWTVAKGLVYLTLSEMYMHGFCLHPYFGYFLGVHGSTGAGEGVVRDSAAAAQPWEVKQCQPTMSTYDFLTSLSCLNLNYHVEHHDFPKVPWSRLHLVYAAAPEFYDNLEWSPGFFTTVWRWIQHGHTWTYACHEDVSWLGRFGLRFPMNNFNHLQYEPGNNSHYGPVNVTTVDYTDGGGKGEWVEAGPGV